MSAFAAGCAAAACAAFFFAQAASGDDTERDMIAEALSPSQLMARVRSGDDFTVVVFAPWCGYCKRFAAEIFSKLPKGRVESFDGDQHGDTLKVKAFPTLLRFRGGKVVDVKEGSAPLATVHSFAGMK